MRKASLGRKRARRRKGRKEEEGGEIIGHALASPCHTLSLAACDAAAYPPSGAPRGGDGPCPLVPGGHDKGRAHGPPSMLSVMAATTRLLGPR